MIEEDESPKLNKQVLSNRLAGKVDGEIALKKLGDEQVLSVSSSVMSERDEVRRKSVV